MISNIGFIPPLAAPPPPPPPPTSYWSVQCDKKSFQRWEEVCKSGHNEIWKEKKLSKIACDRKEELSEMPPPPFPMGDFTTQT